MALTICALCRLSYDVITFMTTKIMAGAEPRDFVHIVSGGGLRDPAERLRKLQSMLNCTWYIMLEFYSCSELLIFYSYPELLKIAYLVSRICFAEEAIRSVVWKFF